MPSATAVAKAIPERCRLIAMSSSSAPPTIPFQSARAISSIGGKTAALSQPVLLATCHARKKAISSP